MTVFKMRKTLISFLQKKLFPIIVLQFKKSLSYRSPGEVEIGQPKKKMFKSAAAGAGGGEAPLLMR
jgi:hypothetical protein